MTTPRARYLVTRMVKDRTAPKRYQRSGWMAFDTTHQQHGQVWPTRTEARRDAARLNGRPRPDADARMKP